MTRPALMSMRSALGLGLLVATAASASTYQADVERARAKYGGGYQVPAASVAWLAKRHGKSAEAVTQDLRAGEAAPEPSAGGPPEALPSDGLPGPEAVSESAALRYMVALEKVATKFKKSGSIPTPWLRWLMTLHPDQGASSQVRYTKVAADGTRALKQAPFFGFERVLWRFRQIGPYFPGGYSVTGWGPDAIRWLAARLKVVKKPSCRLLDRFARAYGDLDLVDTARARMREAGCPGTAALTLELASRAPMTNRSSALFELVDLDLSGLDGELARLVRQVLEAVDRLGGEHGLGRFEEVRRLVAKNPGPAVHQVLAEFSAVARTPWLRDEVALWLALNRHPGGARVLPAPGQR